MSNDSLRKLVNFLLFQAGWLACVLLADWTAIAVAAALVTVHLVVISARPWSELRFIMLGVVLGTVLDGLWFRTGVLQDVDGSIWTPPWLMGIWALFLTTLSHSLVWMHQRVWLWVVLAPLAGPFAYFAAASLGAVSLPYSGLSLLALAAGWLTVFPLLMTMQQRFFPETLR